MIILEKPRTLEESAKVASRRFLDPKYNSVKEPKGLAFGKISKKHHTRMKLTQIILL